MTKGNLGQMNVATPCKGIGRGVAVGRDHSLVFLEDMVDAGKNLNRKQRKALEKLTRPSK